ncbi:MAG: hypothetical protein LBS31_08420, partial [Candidatus Adiutrix sp.]|nr:hypothetical protein [Candidatus Adiutrix sp.]
MDAPSPGLTENFSRLLKDIQTELDEIRPTGPDQGQDGFEKLRRLIEALRRRPDEAPEDGDKISLSDFLREELSDIFGADKVSAGLAGEKKDLSPTIRLLSFLLGE